MFDELHDPHPPTPGLDALAAVSARARALRRRRLALVGTGVATVVACGALAVVAIGGDRDRRLVGVDTPTSDETVVATTVPVPTSPESTAPSTPVVPSSSVAPATSVVPTTSATSATSTTSVVVPLPTDRPMVAIDGGGDAVVFDGSTRRVVFDGRDPDDPPPTEGDAVFVDGVLPVPRTSTVIVSTCCEPIAGGMIRIDTATGAQDFLGFGHQPAILPDGTSMVWNSAETMQVGDTTGSAAAQLGPFDATTGTIADLAVVDRVAGQPEVLVLVVGPDGTFLWRVYPGGGDLQLSTKVSDVTWTDGARVSLAGWSTDSFVVLDGTAGLDEYDAETLAPLPDRHQDVAWSSAWLTPAQRRVVTDDRRLLVDDVQVAGEYVWVR